MNSTTTPVTFEDPSLGSWLATADDADLDQLPFGVIGFDDHHKVRRYNRFESEAALFRVADVLGQDVFVELAPCLNNYLVAGRFEEAREAAQPLDEMLPYVLTFRMRPTRVRLRLLAEAGGATRYILVDRRSGGA